jgi:hypothetical protein
MPRLIAAIEAVRELTDRWDAASAMIPRASEVREIREVITRELTGKEAGNGG